MFFNQDLLVKLKDKTRRKYTDSRNGHLAWGDYRDAIQTCRDGIRKAKVQMELNSATDVKNKKGLYRCINQKRKAKESPVPLKK